MKVPRNDARFRMPERRKRARVFDRAKRAPFDRDAAAVILGIEEETLGEAQDGDVQPVGTPDGVGVTHEAIDDALELAAVIEKDRKELASPSEQQRPHS
jgi:hypothetical protein